MLSKLHGWGFAGAVTLLVLSACGSDDGDAGGAGTGGVAGTGGGAGEAGAAGTAGTGGTGGTTNTGGTGGTTNTGGTGGVAGEGGSTGGSAGEAGAGASAGAGGGSSTLCDELAIDLHTAENWFFTLSDMTEHSTEPAAWDVKMGKSGSGPWITLGEGVEAINLGSDQTFVEVVEAPDTGYQDDPDLIGDSWRTGGAGETGYVMSENVYVLKLQDGTYAKLAVTSAKAGAITLDAFHQADGSTDLTCAMP